ncbi:hypothetical protein HYALB_00007543 [Hymenoscyphus albidus]|uniref:Uncharacterized protein n=1 Tax=Hymenoscyphus albidus TaxID=595503 RepID=A0A9N9LNY3_9HELO|nr:hypothetical protein HYALB_00007543 [Hymenoscyphus albidus]
MNPNAMAFEPMEDPNAIEYKPMVPACMAPQYFFASTNPSTSPNVPTLQPGAPDTSVVNTRPLYTPAPPSYPLPAQTQQQRNNLTSSRWARTEPQNPPAALTEHPMSSSRWATPKPEAPPATLSEQPLNTAQEEPKREHYVAPIATLVPIAPLDPVAKITPLATAARVQEQPASCKTCEQSNMEKEQAIEERDTALLQLSDKEERLAAKEEEYKHKLGVWKGERDGQIKNYKDLEERKDKHIKWMEDCAKKRKEDEKALEAKIAELEKDICNLQGEIAQLRGQDLELTVDYQTLEATSSERLIDITSLKDKNAQLERNSSNLQAEVATLQGQALDLTTDIKTLEGTNSEHLSEISGLKGKTAELEYNSSNLQAVVAKLQGQAFELTNNIQILEGTKSEYLNEIASLKGKNTELDSTSSSLQAEVKKLSVDIQTILEAEVAKLSAESKALSDTNAELDVTSSYLQAEVAELSAENAALSDTNSKQLLEIARFSERSLQFEREASSLQAEVTKLSAENKALLDTYSAQLLQLTSLNESSLNLEHLNTLGGFLKASQEICEISNLQRITHANHIVELETTLKKSQEELKTTKDALEQKESQFDNLHWLYSQTTKRVGTLSSKLDRSTGMQWELFATQAEVERSIIDLREQVRELKAAAEHANERLASQTLMLEIQAKSLEQARKRALGEREMARRLQGARQIGCLRVSSCYVQPQVLNISTPLSTIDIEPVLEEEVEEPEAVQNPESRMVNPNFLSLSTLSTINTEPIPIPEEDEQVEEPEVVQTTDSHTVNPNSLSISTLSTIEIEPTAEDEHVEEPEILQEPEPNTIIKVSRNRFKKGCLTALRYVRFLEMIILGLLSTFIILSLLLSITFPEKLTPIISSLGLKDAPLSPDTLAQIEGQNIVPLLPLPKLPDYFSPLTRALEWRDKTVMPSLNSFAGIQSAISPVCVEGMSLGPDALLGERLDFTTQATQQPWALLAVPVALSVAAPLCTCVGWVGGLLIN